MYLFVLGINAYTDLKEGAVYDALSLALFGSALLPKAQSLLSGWTLGCILLLSLVRVCDPKEQYLGQGDYLIILSTALYFQASLPRVLLWTSGLALIAMALLKKRQLPLIPFLFLGSLIPSLT